MFAVSFGRISRRAFPLTVISTAGRGHFRWTNKKQTCAYERGDSFVIWRAWQRSGYRRACKKVRRIPATLRYKFILYFAISVARRSFIEARLPNPSDSFHPHLRSWIVLPRPSGELRNAVPHELGACGTKEFDRMTERNPRTRFNSHNFLNCPRTIVSRGKISCPQPLSARAKEE